MCIDFVDETIDERFKQGYLRRRYVKFKQGANWGLAHNIIQRFYIFVREIQESLR